MAQTTTTNIAHAKAVMWDVVGLFWESLSGRGVIFVPTIHRGRITVNSYRHSSSTAIAGGNFCSMSFMGLIVSDSFRRQQLGT